LKQTFQAGTFAAFGGVWAMAAVAVVVIKLAASGLLGSEAEFGVGFAALDITGGEGCEERD